VAQLIKDLECIVIFDKELCVIQDRISKSLIGVGRLRGGVYCINKIASSTVQVNAVGTRNLWHGRLGHPSDQVLSLFYKNLNLNSSLENNVKGPCDVCCRAKQRRTKFSASESHAKDLFELIHCDIWGAYRVRSLCGAQYFLTIVDDASRAVWVYLMRAKGEVPRLLQNFVIMVKTQYGKDVKTIRSDNGQEFLGPMKQFYQQKGIIHQTTYVDTPNKMGGSRENIDIF